MMMKKQQYNFLSQRLVRFLSVGVVLLFMGGMLTRCASIGSPSGGPRDTLAPKVLTATPEFNSTDFQSDRIYIAFDEYIQLQNQQKEVYTSPAMRVKPKLSLRGRGLQIEIALFRNGEGRGECTVAIDLKVGDIPFQNEEKLQLAGSKID